MSEHQIFGTESNFESSEIILLPVPWDVTTSYGRGTRLGPSAILKASPQIDFNDYDFGDVSKRGLFLLPENPQILDDYEIAEPLAQKVIDEYHQSNGLQPLSKAANEAMALVNEKCNSMVQSVYKESKKLLDIGKVVGVVGGDHSSPLGLIQALSEKYNEFGILHVDAHADLRNAYMGFIHSHASIMYNVLRLPHSPKKIVQIGIRDFCKEEQDLINEDPRLKTFYGPQIFDRLFSGQSWNTICEDILSELPQNIYISFDIDGMNPEYCPHTGTPVPGGLSFMQIEHLLRVLKKSNKNVIGFDLCEVTPDPKNENEWDGNVGARILYKLCGVVQ